MSLTVQQQKAASASGSVAVTAGAGTGKTHMLAERYVHHLQAHELSPLEIVAVTFTEKAASELRARIRATVSKQLPHHPDLLAELEAAQISTIHALAMRICREHPEAAGVPADFTVLDKYEGALRASEWLDEALDTLPVKLYEQISHSLMSQVLQILLCDPISAEKAFTQDTSNWQQLAQELQQNALDELLQHPTWQEVRDTLQIYSGSASDRLEVETRQPALQAINVLEMGGSPKEALSVIDKLKINFGSKKNWKEGALEIVKECIKQLRDLVQNYLKAGLITLEISAADQKLAAILPQLREAFDLVKKYIRNAKYRERVLDFADLEVGALQALQDTQVQFYYAQRWKAFLIDEFQDVNPVQSEMLQKITSNALLTIVGDAKQSIYGFRRADVQIFGDWCNKIENNGGNKEVLSTSFRTHKPLVDNINSIFAPLLGELHQDLDAYRTECPHDYPAIRVYTVEGADTNKPQRLRVEAAHIARLLKEMLDKQTLVHDKKTNTLRPIVAGDIAILSRTWAPLEDYGEALESLGIPVALAGGGNLLETREAKDAWALLRFLADTSDDLALVAVLRSPFFAVSDKVLFIFIQAQEKQTSESKINWWQNLKNSDYLELRRPVEVLSKLLHLRNLESPTRLLQLADNLTGYTAVIANLAGAPRRDADWRGFFDLVRELEHGNSDVFAVVRRLKRLAYSVEIPRPALSASNAVSLMTIHAAKGLEWSVVVVPDLTRKEPGTGEVVYFDPTYGVALKLGDEESQTKPVLYVWLEQLRKQQENEEALRVLYVALTRVRDKLILTANSESRGRLKLLEPGLNAAGITINSIPFDEESAKPPILPDPPLPAEPHSLLIKPTGSGLFELPVTALTEYAICPARFQYKFIQGHPGIGSGFATAGNIGILTHLALERGIRDIDILADYDTTLSREDVETALQLAQRFDEVADFAAFQQGQREKSVTLNIGGLTLNGIVDILGEDWVLDFKTDQEINPNHHRFQLWAYAKATDSKTAHIAYLRHNYLHTCTTAELESTAQEAEILVQNILDGHYSAAPSQKNCSYCAYAEICENNYRETGHKELSLVDMETQLQQRDSISQLTSYFPQAAEQYYQLIIVPYQNTSSINFRQIAETHNSGYINVNLELSRRLLELTQRQRALKAEELLKKIVNDNDNEVIFLEHLEILFDVSLKLNPLGCLQRLSRNRIIVAVWNGSIENNHLIYAEPEHPEYKSYPIDGFLVVNKDAQEREKQA